MSWSVLGEGGLCQGDKRGSYPSESVPLSEGAPPPPPALPPSSLSAQIRYRGGTYPIPKRPKRSHSFRSVTLARTATFVTFFCAPTRRRSHRARPVSVSVSPGRLAHARKLRLNQASPVKYSSAVAA